MYQQNMKEKLSPPTLRARIYRVVKRIPSGRVLTYGGVARLLDLPRASRMVGYAMAACPPDVPWQRVVGKSRTGFGRISIRDSFFAELQRQLLEEEGLTFTESGEIDLVRYGARSAIVPRARSTVLSQD